MKKRRLAAYIKQRIKRIRFAGKRLGMRIEYALCKREDTAVFAAFSGKKYADNPRAVSEALHALAPEVRIVWLFHDPKAKRALLPDYAEAEIWKSRAAEKVLARAKVWVFSDPAPAFLSRGADQLYIQTWHGDRGFKKILFDSENVDAASEDPLIEKDICGLMLAGSDRGETKLRSAFMYRGEVQKLGCPRNDSLVGIDQAARERTRQALGIRPEERILLFAPTLRRDAFSRRGTQDVGKVNIIACLDALERADGHNWRCFVRAHSGVAGLEGVQTDARIQDVTACEDMADLLVAADILLTDYSSSAGDFALTGRPVVLYQPDRDAYQKEDRSFYFDPDDSPFWIEKTPEALLERLQNLGDATENDRAILEFYGACESGAAAEETAKRILRFIREGK